MNVLGASSRFFFMFRRTALDKRIVSSIRTLYNDQYLSVDRYVDVRESTRKQFGNMKDNFFLRMKNQMNGASLVFTEDLKSVLHLCEDSPDDIEVFKTMLKKFNQQNKELRFGTFVFGPVVMRMLYHLQKSDLALELLRDQEIAGFFDQLRSYLLVMNILYKKGQYQDVLDLNEAMQSRQIMETKFPRDILVLVMASCYKLNTPESFQYAMNLITEARGSGATILQKTLYFAINLALNQKKPDVALELLSSLRLNNNSIANNLKLVALAYLDRHQEALAMLHRKTEQDQPMQSMIRGNICQSSLDAIRACLERVEDTESSHTLDQLQRSLEETGSITAETIDDFLHVPIAPRVEDLHKTGSPMSRVPGSMYRGRDQGFFNEERQTQPRNRRAYNSNFTD